MLKKIFLIMFSIFFLSSIFQHHSFDQKVSAQVQEEKSEIELFGLYALWFIGSDIYTNEESKWNENTRIKEIIPIKDFSGTIIGYTFELKTKNKEAGYVFVSYDDENLAISEYAYEGIPLYKAPKISGKIRDVFTEIPGEYFILTTSNKLYDLSGNKINRDIISNTTTPSKKIINADLNKQLRSFETTLEEWMVGYNGQISGATGTNAGIFNTYQYMIDHYGTGWAYATNKELPVSAYLQGAFEPGTENCVLSSVTTVLKYYQQNKGYSKIPNSIYTIYADVKTIATKHGYTASGGTPFTKINNIVTDSFKKYGYTVTGNTDYVVAFSRFVSEINSNRPVLFSNTGGYYQNHNFVVVGYRTYTKGLQSRDFLRVNDNWTTDERWFNFSAWIGAGSLTRMSN